MVHTIELSSKQLANCISTRLADTVQKKRIDLTLKLTPSNDYKDTIPLFEYFIRMQDQLVSTVHFRPEAMRKVRQTRDEEIKKIKKVDDDEKAEERRVKGDKEKKEKRDATLKGMNADEQRKYLEKEREKDARRSQKKRTVKA